MYGQNGCFLFGILVFRGSSLIIIMIQVYPRIPSTILSEISKPQAK